MSAPVPGPLVAVKLTPVGRAQTFLPGDLPVGRRRLRSGDQVVVQTDGGPAVGTVVRRIPQLDDKRRPPADSPQRVVRLATRDDVVARLKHQHREQEAHRIALLKIRERGLGMKLTRVEQAFDGSKLVFYFTAEGRVDFRELVRELASEFRTRIEMRQIGVRDEAKMIGGYGTCGRPLCCTTFLHVVRAGVDQDGEAAGSQPQSVEAVGPVRPAEMLPALRAAERERRVCTAAAAAKAAATIRAAAGPAAADAAAGGCGSRLRKFVRAELKLKPK